MTIQEIYQKYRIMPNLQLHMYRVAAVGLMIVENFDNPDELDAEAIAQALLLHDMGNILKFDLQYFPDFLEPEGLEYWQSVKDEFEKEYGKNVHAATLDIAKEIGASSRVEELIDAVGFNHARRNLDSSDFSQKICAYADMRVAPHGVVSLEERLVDGRKRYAKADSKDTFSYVMGVYLRKIEKQIFERCGIDEEDIAEESVKEKIRQLSLSSF